MCYNQKRITRSSNGRTEAFEAFNWGSSPCRAAKKENASFTDVFFFFTCFDRDEKDGAKFRCERSEPKRVSRGRAKFSERKFMLDRVPV